ncbi:MOSC domain-containing protein [Undibacterium rugosum]|uniref:MOSC domain-containing protein n=1 Tax=Undibacterium rugosum TaxID=2762291 RepID=UPI001B83224F|nr:MOSC N-terminal beta barrel domain-containing protein [Undibacterium rugosum]MBR7779089.1 MOSC N-terminal beta barrel domain-containing protein [Undibacterium rugosum]
MPYLSELTLYPIKSCAGISLSNAVVGESGLVYQGIRDREWMLVTPDGQFLTQRSHPHMARLRTRIEDGVLHVSWPGRPDIALPPDIVWQRESTVTVWDDTLPALDAGDTIAAWFSAALGENCRLVKVAPHAQRTASLKWTGEPAVRTLFSDGYPFLLAAQSSLDDLNQRAAAQGHAAVPINRFRPNLVIADSPAFEEDYAAQFVFSDGIELRSVKPCTRCPMPAVDQTSGIAGWNPVDILQSYRSNPKVDGETTFGVNLIVAQGLGQTLQVGAQLDIDIAF